MPSSPAEPRGPVAAGAVRWGPAVGPGLLMLAIALIGAGRPVLSWDEIATADAARRTPDQIWHLIQHIDGVFGAYYFLIHFWTQVAGSGELALRFPSILAMAGAVALTGELGRRLLDPLTGAVAGTLLCLMPNTSRYAAEARPHAFACFFAVLALLALHRALDRPGWARWTGYGAAVFMLGLSHVIALTTLGAHVAVLVQRRRLPVSPPPGLVAQGDDLTASTWRSSANTASIRCSTPTPVSRSPRTWMLTGSPMICWTQARCGTAVGAVTRGARRRGRTVATQGSHCW